ncbi:Gfo/Idh/MocA family oxidoreductase [Planotetraspora sp. A-T 1434]|uniref:Gfo/Idh/MocA family protein n=1 Tax=Planotetraspora sp. A-T 1434 TaxID=2979219 RepID=UPI0021C0ECF3|nr:Gfo/Idh/MocA family oxidoreductase [Planotetraspora sp. A-T 1434]MCT9928996.1 Gfo/Idh/MocA family oxidoreductase [Planotetraspora sp. A-T 1434]
MKPRGSALWSPIVSEFRWGIAATGGIARSVGNVIAREPGMSVAAVGSRDLDRARGLAAELGAPRAYGSYAELAGDPDIDAIYVTTPQAQHLEVVELAIAAGRAVLCEKPLTADLAEAERMVRLARDKGVFLMEAMWMRFNPLIAQIAGLVADGEIGDLRSVNASFGFALPYDTHHRLWDPALGGGALLDLGVYPVSFAHLLLGEPAAEDVAVHGSLAESGVDAEAALLLGWPGGRRALLETSLVSPLPTTASVIGTTGRIDVDELFFAPTRFVLTVDGAEPRVHEIPDREVAFAAQAREVRRAVEAGETESPVMPLDDTLAVMRLLDLAVRRLRQA